MEQIKSLVEAGKATAGPPLGPALGPLGVPINDVVQTINEKTKEFAGMQVPVTVKVDPSTKDFEIEVGSPPVSALIKKELNLEKGSGSPKEEKVADMLIEQAIKIAKMKEKSIFTQDTKGAVKTVVGTCVSMGILVEGKDPKETLEDIDSGKFDKKIKEGKTELSEEDKKKLEEKKKKLAEELRKAHEEEEQLAKEILEQMKGKDPGDIKHAMKEEGISITIINKVMPTEGVPGVEAAPGAAAEGAAGAEAPVAGAPAEESAEKKKEEKKEE
ncbi:MAG: 50S ribosomal protein L11 [Candidatus Undinarchaeales archaeon]